MKKIMAQSSSFILNNILPMHAIDNSFSVLTAGESHELFDLWKNGKAINNNREVILPLSYNRANILILQEKGYIKLDGLKIAFTQMGSETIKKIILAKEDNAFKKQSESCKCQEKQK